MLLKGSKDKYIIEYEKKKAQMTEVNRLSYSRYKNKEGKSKN
ncbi:hypothetical protein SAMN05661044_03072 [Olivibacter domesticus]|uniref:Uncharacterized protein n=1 Tax=Olivibacter domesticus TaxID=407022 RepID=A0A1H7S5J3_OLID1|nr:hypothetical protein SAMN05661044_03072 [Olivibacter domesticus]